MPVNQNERKLNRKNAITRIAPKLKELRASLGMKQTDFGAVCGVTAVQVSRWEKELDLPNGKALLALAKLASDDEKAWWLAEAGVDSAPEPTKSRSIPVLKDAAAAGTPRAIDEKEIRYTIQLPRELLPRGGSIYGVPVEGDSMSPILETGYLAFVDTTPKDPVKLVGKMVAARDADGVTIKWLRRQGDVYLLVPQHTSPRHQVQIMQKAGDWSIVGEVVTWIGYPPPLSR